MKKQATVGDLVDALAIYDRKLPLAIEDGEWGPLLCVDGIEVKLGKAQHPSYDHMGQFIDKAVIVGHK